jgi:hypothetical protein
LNRLPYTAVCKNVMQKNSVCEVCSCLLGQEIPLFFENPNINYHVLKVPPLEQILVQFDRVQPVTHCSVLILSAYLLLGAQLLSSLHPLRLKFCTCLSSLLRLILRSCIVSMWFSSHRHSQSIWQSLCNVFLSKTTEATVRTTPYSWWIVGNCVVIEMFLSIGHEFFSFYLSDWLVLNRRVTKEIANSSPGEQLKSASWLEWLPVCGICVGLALLTSAVTYNLSVGNWRGGYSRNNGSTLGKCDLGGDYELQEFRLYPFSAYISSSLS